MTHSTMQKTEPLSFRHDFDFARIADWKLIENKTTKQNKIQKRKKRKRGEKKKKKRKKEKKRDINL